MAKLKSSKRPVSNQKRAILDRNNIFVRGVDLTRQDQSFSFRMREVVNLYRKLLNQDIKYFGVSPGAWIFLRALWEEEGLSQKQLSDILGMTTAAAVFSINKLERDGLAKRVPDAKDARRYNIFLTPHGRSLRKKLLPVVRASYLLALKGISEDDFATFLGVLDHIKRNLNRSISEYESVSGQTKPSKLIFDDE